MAESKEFEPHQSVYGGNVKNSGSCRFWEHWFSLCAGWGLAGCKSAPELTQDQALAMIQTKIRSGIPLRD